MATAPTLNGTTFYPSDISIDDRRIGVNFQAVNGARRTAYRSVRKKDVKLSWKQVSLSVLTALRTIVGLSSTFTFVDENAVSYTVFVPSSEVALTSSVAAILSDGTVEYDITLTLWEA